MRRHPMKPAGWVKNRYFRIVGYRHWVFAAKVRGDGGISFLSKPQKFDTFLHKFHFPHPGLLMNSSTYNAF